MGTHQHHHEPVEFPGGSTNADGQVVDGRLLGELMGAALNDCAECVDQLLSEVARDSACLSRLVEVSRLTALRVYQGELPPFMTDDDDRSGPGSMEFRRLVRAVNAAEPLVEEYGRMTHAERRRAADTALDLLVGHLTVAHYGGMDGGQTRPQACVAVGLGMVDWWFTTAPVAAREFTDRWRKRVFAHRDLGVPGNSTDALGVFLGAVLHRQAVQDDATVGTIADLVFTRAVPVLREPEQAGGILRTWAAPPEADDIAVPVKRLARHDDDALTELCRFARHVLSAHTGDCPHGLRQVEHACTVAHRASAIISDAQTPASAQATKEGRRVALPRIGYREDEPVEGAPDDYPTDHAWQINVDRILLERWDADVARGNDNVSEDSTISEPNYDHEVGLEALACPACGSQESFLVEGRWGDPLTLHCRCGVTVMSPLDAPPDDLGRRLLKRLILCEADPAYAARRLMPPLAEHREREHRSRAYTWYCGPEAGEVALAEAIDLNGEELVQALMAALRPKLPERHGGRALTLLLLRVAFALSIPAVSKSKDGRRLADEACALVSDLKAECDRWASSRQPVPDRLQAWRDEGGPDAWQAAWTRTLEVAGPRFARHRVRDGILSDGCAALTLAIYILSREAGTGADQVSVDDVRDLLPVDSAEPAGEAPPRWGARLQALGHDLDAEDDPVAALWRHLCTERPVGIIDERLEPALVAGLDRVLDPMHGVRF
ncbi:hypothetical protein [Streptomyces boncukensis]|uniref:Uncharacterized protein n=1 Tax=Streptomyces boncukensis TaxID=2711219 RepID=A0A6G4WR14_9ACTN|nr:hypothetical protein [Streptomyces boncukensis]NGO67080.1 hypothetical protein [Streptomyces boncukensis]